MANAQAFDAIFMDLHMPVMDGLAATRAIRSSDGPNARTPIIALTADTAREQIDRCLEAGMNDHVAKPIRPDALFAALGRALDPEPAEEIALEAPLGAASDGSLRR
jgi:CheY-like chemotaxis protein